MMIKRNKTLMIASLVGLLILTSVVQGQEARPNIVLIMADDVSWEAFGCYGAVDYETPHIDKLAAEGVRFSHCYSTPLCTPSRVMIMTGKYNYRNYTHFGYLGPDEKTFGHLFQNAGYRTMIAGKWQLNGIYDEHPGCQDNTRVYKAGFDEFALCLLHAEYSEYVCAAGRLENVPFLVRHPRRPDPSLRTV